MRLSAAAAPCRQGHQGSGAGLIAHALKIDNEVIQEFIDLDDEQLWLIFFCLKKEAHRMATPADSQSWALCDEREQQCRCLMQQISNAWRPAREWGR